MNRYNKMLMKKSIIYEKIALSKNYMLNMLLVSLFSILIPINLCAQSMLPDLEIWQPDIIHAPQNADEWTDFREKLHSWREKARNNVKYDDRLYHDPAFQWASTAYNCYFLMMYDEEFFDYRNNVYKTDEFLDRLLTDYGYIDMIVLWHAYPRIGLDHRNQFDFYRDMPGGLNAVREVCRHLHQRGVKVFINYNPWDTGTCPENVSDIEGLTYLIKAIDADGIFLDTLPLGSSEFRTQLDAIKKGVALESELALPVEGIFDHHLSWAQWFDDSLVPGILRNKWFEKRHMQHTISRWTQNKMRDLQIAWMNGSGTMIWENVFGQYLVWSERDKYMIRTMSSIQHRYSNIFSNGEWFPLQGTIEGTGIYSNMWEKDGVRLWTLVNRTKAARKGELISIEKRKNERYFDLIRGIEIDLKENKSNNVLCGELIPEGLGCFVALDNQLVDDHFLNFVSSQAKIHSQKSENSFSPILPVSKKTVEKTEQYASPLKGMVEIPAVTTTQNVLFRVREIGYYESMDSSFINAVYPKLHHLITKQKHIVLTKYALDETPVTNKQFKAFIDATGYKPIINDSFLKHWNNNEIPFGKEDHPVVYVDLNDARAYAKWANKRLPTEEEWQFAAQGTKMYKYPWGNIFDANKCHSDGSDKTKSVYRFPEGKSAFGCYDMCGNVWELTESECTDGHTRFCILKGGSSFKAQGSDWYFIGGAQPSDFAAKQILIHPGIDRCSTVGFRCAIDLK